MGVRTDNAIGLYMLGIRDGMPREAQDAYTGDRYTQHSTGVKDGREGFIEFFDEFIERNPDRDIEVLRAWEDGRHVFVHALQILNGGESQWVTTDFFDTDENGKIVEHWDVIAEYVPQTPSGHTSVDGPSEVVDLGRTEENKAVVRSFIDDVMMTGGDPGLLDRYISSEQYVQHNPEVEDGLESFRRLAAAEDRSLNYDEIVLLVGQGSFVATLCKANWQGAPLAQVDIFRLEDGLIVEHWDNSEPVPPAEELVNSGKF